MIGILKNNSQILLQPFQILNIDSLLNYFDQLSDKSKNRFGPHPFTREAILKKLDDDSYIQYIAISPIDNSIVAYTIIKFGWIESDETRLKGYDLIRDKFYDCTFAPSVTDTWQSKGVGSMLFEFILDDLKSNHHINRIILWGGVQNDNTRALNFYKKYNFKILGEFEHNGKNLDMVLDLNG